MNTLLSITGLSEFRKTEIITPTSTSSTSSVSQSSSITDYFKNIFERVMETIFTKSLSDEDLFRIMKKVSPNITLDQVKKISLYIHQNSDKLLEQAMKDGKDVIVYSHTKKEGLARSVVFTKTGHVYILCNRVKSLGDKLIGKGGAKNVTTAVDLKSGSVVASVGAEFTNEKELTALNNVKGDPRFIQVLDAVSYEDKVEEDILKYRIFFKFYEKGDLNRQLNDPQGMSSENKRSIFKKLIHGAFNSFS